MKEYNPLSMTLVVILASFSPILSMDPMSQSVAEAASPSEQRTSHPIQQILKKTKTNYLKAQILQLTKNGHQIYTLLSKRFNHNSTRQKA